MNLAPYRINGDRGCNFIGRWMALAGSALLPRLLFFSLDWKCTNMLGALNLRGYL